MAVQYKIVDLFAGPGGLSEGFASFRDPSGSNPFKIGLSIEKEALAFETLRLRSFLRHFGSRFPREYYDFLNSGGEEPNWEVIYPKQWRAACSEVLNVELGSPAADALLAPRLKQFAAMAGSDCIVIGGPPCQAYSLVGRARNRGVRGYRAGADNRHFLYREYIRVLRLLRPAVFVMENVEGMLSSSVDGERIFETVLNDLRKVGGKDGYTLTCLVPTANKHAELALPRDQRSFLVQSEKFGIPQTRHRIIIVGVRGDIAKRRLENILECDRHEKREWQRPPTTGQALAGLPRLRSGLSSNDSDVEWVETMNRSFDTLIKIGRSHPELSDIGQRARELQKKFAKQCAYLRRSSRQKPKAPRIADRALTRWIADPRLETTPNSFARAHMAADLPRYLFVSIYGQVRGESPKSRHFPKELFPAHRSWKEGVFADRFSVQLKSRPSRTVTSHIAKDGHYFIHPDPIQCRSLTVREAARLQTFPDNYFFKGGRTSQYVQVGNAVPPYLALKIAEVTFRLLSR